MNILTKAHILKIIGEGENSVTEFKREEEKLEDFLKVIVAFANGRGGYLVIGIDDDRKILGVSDAKKLEEKLMNSCADSIKPIIVPDLFFPKIDDKVLVIVEVPPGINKPYAVVRRKKERFYLRRGTTVKEASREELLRLYQSSGHINYEITPVAQAKIEDLNLRQIRNFFLQNPLSPVDLDAFEKTERLTFLANKELITSFNTDFKPTLAGLLLFGKAPEQILFFCGITITRFRGLEKDYEYKDYKIAGPILPDKDENGNVLKNGIVLKALNILESWLIDQSRAFLSNGQRILEYPYKMESLREAILNAIAHRDYTITGADIGVDIFDDRIEIHSPGKIPNTLTIEKMKLGAKYYRNQIIVQYLKEAGFVDMHSLGIPIKILKLSLEYSGREPKLEDREDEFVVTLYARKMKEPGV